MLAYSFHIGDFARDTRGLDVAQIGIYHCLMDWCYANERPLPINLAKIVAILPGWRTTKGKNVQLQEILDRFFVRDVDGWHQPHIERVLERYYERKPIIAAKAENNRERQRRFRDNRKKLFEALRAAGCVMPYNTTNEDLRAMCSKLGISNPCAYSDDASVSLPKKEADVTQNGVVSRVNGARVNGLGDDKSCIPSSLYPLERERVAVTGREALLQRALAVEEIVRKAGIRGASKGDPRLHALLADGVEPEAFALPAAQCSSSGKSWAYLLGMVKGRTQDASGTHQNDPGGDVGRFLRGLVWETPKNDPGASGMVEQDGNEP